MPGTEIASRGTYMPSSGGGPRAPGSDDGLHYAPQPDKVAFPTPAVPAPAAPPTDRPNRPRRPPSLRPFLISGDRDWIIYVECRADCVLVYPSWQVVPLTALTLDPAGNPLQRVVQQMIDRRQATLRPGDPPYRPQVRFLVRPEQERVYHLAYPMLDRLPVPKTRQTLLPEDDVQAIITGN
jgi:hypothetical protein